MLELILTLLPTLGSAGAGSVLKMLGGAIQEYMAARTVEKREKMALILRDALANRQADLDFQKAVFGGNNEDSRSSLVTRRILAVMGMSTFAVIAILCTCWPGVTLITFAPPELAGGGDVSVLWGFVSFPKSAAVVTTAVTTGHITLMAMNALVMILAFYFTPGGRK